MLQECMSTSQLEKSQCGANLQEELEIATQQLQTSFSPANYI